MATKSETPGQLKQRHKLELRVSGCWWKWEMRTVCAGTEAVLLAVATAKRCQAAAEERQEGEVEQERAGAAGAESRARRGRASQAGARRARGDIARGALRRKEKAVHVG